MSEEMPEGLKNAPIRRFLWKHETLGGFAFAALVIFFDIRNILTSAFKQLLRRK